MFVRTALDLAANAINAYQVRSVPGFASTPFGGLMLLWACQPRIAWVDVLRLANTSSRRDTFSSSIMKFLFPRIKSGQCYPKLAPTLGRELLLEIVALVYMGIAIRFADLHGYFLVGAAVPSDAKMLYIGAALSLASTVVVLAFSPLGLVFLLKADRNAYKKGERDMQDILVAVIFALPVAFLYMATWIFWSGFIKLSGDL